MAEYRQERPAWCPHRDCVFRRRVTDAACGGELPKPEPHDGDLNTHRVCVNAPQDPEAKPGAIFDLQVNASDLDWLRWIFDALDGKETSWLSKRGKGGPA